MDENFWKASKLNREVFLCFYSALKLILFIHITAEQTGKNTENETQHKGSLSVPGTFIKYAILKNHCHKGRSYLCEDFFLVVLWMGYWNPDLI